MSKKNQVSVTVEFKSDGVTTILTSSGNKHEMEIKVGSLRISSKRLSPDAFRKIYLEILDGVIPSRRLPCYTEEEEVTEKSKESEDSITTEIPAVKIGIGE